MKQCQYYQVMKQSKINDVESLFDLAECTTLEIDEHIALRASRAKICSHSLVMRIPQEIHIYMLNDMIALTISESCSFKALTAFFRDTVA